MEKGIKYNCSIFDTNYDYLFKILLLGDAGVGKSSLIQQYVDGKVDYFGTKPTVGIDFQLKYINTDSCRFLLQIWDSSGQQRYRELIKQLYSKVMGIMLVYDITSETSSANFSKWVDGIREHAFQNTQILLVGNKYDMASKRVAACEEIRRYAEAQNITYVETSVNDNFQVSEAFEILMNQIMRTMKQTIDSNEWAIPLKEF